METGIIIPSRLLPKTGSIIDTQDGEDGDIQAGWWKGLKIANNKTRYSEEWINGDVVIIDHATGLMWPKDGGAAGCNEGNTIAWAAGITYANALVMAGYNDWRMPNIRELMSLINYGLHTPAISEPPFINTQTINYWSSTTAKVATTQAWYIGFGYGDISLTVKTEVNLIRCVRGGI